MDVLDDLAGSQDIERREQGNYDPSQVEFLERIDAAYPLSDSQRATFQDKGFVVYETQKFFTFVHAHEDPLAASAPDAQTTTSMSYSWQNVRSSRVKLP